MNLTCNPIISMASESISDWWLLQTRYGPSPMCSLPTTSMRQNGLLQNCNFPQKRTAQC
jgi:hypothetical protein